MHIIKQNFPKIIKKDHTTNFILASKDESELRTDKMTVLPQITLFSSDFSPPLQTHINVKIHLELSI